MAEETFRIGGWKKNENITLVSGSKVYDGAYLDPMGTYSIRVASGDQATRVSVPDDSASEEECYLVIVDFASSGSGFVLSSTAHGSEEFCQ